MFLPFKGASRNLASLKTNLILNPILLAKYSSKNKEKNPWKDLILIFLIFKDWPIFLISSGWGKFS